MAEEYVCTLDDASLKKAMKELNEDPKERDSAVQTLREWLQQQKWLRTPTDSCFLLAFLRTRKFSQLAARTSVEKYWTIRSENKDWFDDIDPADPKIQAFLKLGVFVLLPGRDKNGQKMMIERPGALDFSLLNKKFTVNDVFRASFCMMDYCMMDENVQVNGMVIFSDMTGFTAKHETVFGLDKMKRSLNVWQNGYPARFKGFHIYNVGPVFEALWGVLKVFMKEKLRKRIVMHSRSLVSVYKDLDMAMLPDEYLPDDYQGPTIGSMDTVCDKMINELIQPEMQARIKALSSCQYGVDLSLKPKDDAPAESFRKLNVD
ncbi:hypothetical protein ScPMuIL_000614 [Solemya velum]